MTGTIEARTVHDERRPVGAHRAAERPVRERPVGELVHQATEQLSLLVRQEVALAKEELAAKGKRAGRGGGLLGAAGALGYVGLFALAAAAGAAVFVVLPVWAAALVVAGALFLLAGLLALVGRFQLHRAGSPAPQETIGSVRADVEEIKGRAHHR